LIVINFSMIAVNFLLLGPISPTSVKLTDN